jgi:uncharacterized protein
MRTTDIACSAALANPRFVRVEICTYKCHTSLMKIDGVDWDAGNWPKCGKHGVSREEIEYALAHGARIAPDLKHSNREDRFIVVSRNEQGRPVFIIVMFREVAGQRLIRPVSARYMHAKEAKRYAAQSAETED